MNFPTGYTSRWSMRDLVPQPGDGCRYGVEALEDADVVDPEQLAESEAAQFPGARLRERQCGQRSGQHAIK